MRLLLSAREGSWRAALALAVLAAGALWMSNVQAARPGAEVDKAPLVIARTPDGQPPSQETACDGLHGAAYGLCNAYCEAQDCDVHERPSCERLRRNYARITGTPVFPCDPRCGDGEVNPGEECDDGNDDECDGCSPTCTLESCGDGVECAEEECDDGNNDECDGCSPTCTTESCGDGVVCPGEGCDDGNNDRCDGCSPTCTTESCGDGVVCPGEGCDDGNNDECDGCSPACRREFCGDGVVCPNQGEECEPGDFCPNETTCTEDCTCPTCPISDAIIDTDGTASPLEGGPAFQEVRCGDPIRRLNGTGNPAGLDTLNPAYGQFSGFHAWEFGRDDLHLEDPTAGTCPTAARNAFYDNNDAAQDCVVLDLDGSLFDGQGVACDNACDPLLSFHDLNGNGVYNDGEDIVLDSNGNGIFD